MNISSYDAREFFELAHWAKEQQVLQAWERSLAFDTGRYLANGWKLSEKQARNAQRIMQVAMGCGFCSKSRGRFASVISSPNVHPSPHEVSSKSVQQQVSKHSIEVMASHDYHGSSVAVPDLASQNKESEEYVPTPHHPVVDQSLLAEFEQSAHQANKIGVDSLQLTTGVLMGLKEAGIQTVKQLGHCTVGDLQHVHHLGPKRVHEIGRKLRLFLEQTLIQLKAAEQKRVQAIPLAKRRTAHISVILESICQVFVNQMPISDITIRLPSGVKTGLLGLCGESPETLSDLRRIVRKMGTNLYFYNTTWDKDYLITLDSLLDWILGIKKATIDSELTELLSSLTAREQKVMVNRYGITQTTLEQLGTEFGVTRERIRQIEVKARRKLARRLSKPLSLFYSTAALVLLQHLGQNATIGRWQRMLFDMRIINEDKSLNQLIAVGRATDSNKLPMPETLETLLKTSLPPRLLTSMSSVRGNARKIVRRCGAVNTRSLINDSLSEKDIEVLLIAGGFKEVTPGWWFDKTEGSLVIKIAKKVIEYCGPVSASDLRNAIEKHLRRFGAAAPPTNAIVGLLKETGHFTLVEGDIHYNSISTTKSSLSKPERVFMHIVQNQGPILTFESLGEYLLANGIPSPSFTGLISNSPLVHRVSNRLYSLTGARFSASDIEDAKAKLIRMPTNTKIRPRSDGVIEFETNIGTWTTRGHVLSFGLSAPLRGEWGAISGGVNHGNLIVDKGFIRGLGLSNVVKELSLVCGDRIIIEFNTWTHEATIERKSINEKGHRTRTKSVHEF